MHYEKDFGNKILRVSILKTMKIISCVEAMQFGALPASTIIASCTAKYALKVWPSAFPTMCNYGRILANIMI
jgi:hypothetical protein